MKNGSRLLALLGLGALAFWRYKKATPEEKQKVNDLIDTAKDNLSKFGSDLKSKAEEVKGKADQALDNLKSKADDLAEKAEDKISEVKSDAQDKVEEIKSDIQNA